MILIGGTEVLAAAGLVLPKATGMLPWLTALAAVGLAVIGLMAAGFHVRANENLNVLETTLLASIGVAIAIGRWDLIDSSVDVTPWTVVVAFCLLVPAAIINVIVLYTGGTQQAASAHSSSGQVSATRQPLG